MIFNKPNFLVILTMLSVCMVSCQEKPNFTCIDKYDGDCSGVQFRYDTEYHLKGHNQNLYGKVKKVIQTNYQKNNTSKVVQTFNPNGNTTSLAYLRADNSINSKIVRKYNKFNQIFEELSYSSDTTRFDAKQIFEFKENKQYSYSLNSENKKILENIVEYNSKGYRTNAILNSFLENYKINKTTYYEYDKNGRLIKQRSSDGSETNFLIDDSGNTIGHFNKEKDTTYYNYRFDKFKNQIMKDEQFEYDKENNWIKKYKIINEEKHLIAEREIQYY